MISRAVSISPKARSNHSDSPLCVCVCVCVCTRRLHRDTSLSLSLSLSRSLSLTRPGESDRESSRLTGNQIAAISRDLLFGLIIARSFRADRDERGPDEPDECESCADSGNRRSQNQSSIELSRLLPPDCHSIVLTGSIATGNARISRDSLIDNYGRRFARMRVRCTYISCSSRSRTGKDIGEKEREKGGRGEEKKGSGKGDDRGGRVRWFLFPFPPTEPPPSSLCGRVRERYPIAEETIG